MNTPSANNTNKKLEGPQLKRLSVSIQYKNYPEKIVSGYALSHEILDHQVSFFAAQKFPIDEPLLVTYHINGEEKSYTVMMKHMHEQISSGRIMNHLPSEQNPCPALKFFRCYSKVIETKAEVAPTAVEPAIEELKVA